MGSLAGSRASELRPLVVAGALAVAATMLATGAAAAMHSPPAGDLSVMAVSLLGTAGLGIATALVVRRISHRISFTGQIVTFVVIALALSVVNVGVAAGLMFLSRHDLEVLFVLLAFSVVATAGPAFLMGRHTGRRVSEIEGATQRVADGDLATRILDPGTDEIGRIAGAIDAMTAKLELAERRQVENEAARRELFAAISHDLRTPLAAMRATIEALIDGVVTDDATRDRYLATAAAEIRRASALIDDLFELATIDAGELRLHFELLNVEDLIAEAVDAFQPQVSQKGIRLEFERHGGCSVQADAQRLGRVLYNLLQNALRHTPPDGSIVLSTQVVDGAVEVVVRDTGEGIPANDADRVFERFYRGEKSRSREFGGSGLGLSIARGIVQAHGGSIRVQGGSTGAAIAFRIPVAT